MTQTLSLDGSGLITALVQALFLAALFSSFGTALFALTIAPLAAPARRLLRASLAATLLLAPTWLLLETAAIAGTASLPETVRALPLVAFGTEFGHLVLAQIALCLVSLALPRPRLVAVLAGLATLLQAWHLHGAAMAAGLSLLLIAEAFHVMAAGAWLGSLVPLALHVRDNPGAQAAHACRRYTRLGAACVGAIAVSATVQAAVLVGSPQALFGTAYGNLVLVKTALFVSLAALAVRHARSLVPALSIPAPQLPEPGRRLQRSITVEAAIGLLVLIVASVLASLPPGMDMTVGPPGPAPSRSQS